jgi:hypothetical protein
VLPWRLLDLFSRELLAVNGTRIKAVNNKDRNVTRGSFTKFIELADAKLDDYLQRLDESDASESKTSSALPQPSAHFFSCNFNPVGLDAKSSDTGAGKAGPADRVTRRVTWLSRGQ